MTPAEDRELFEYFEGRRSWSLYADRDPPELVEQPRGAADRDGTSSSP
jgi:hypothetical protein